MPTAVAIRFPLGRFHATPWDRAVNEGEVEWPPSPWRLFRALVATWHARWPELPPERFDRLLSALAAGPPAYRTSEVSRGHTRHYMPDLAHKSGVPSTDLVLDPFLWVDPDLPMIVRWEAELTSEERADFGKLCELVPYLGRSESVAQLELLDSCPEPDDGWWRADAPHRPVALLLQPSAEITRKELEITSVEVRRRRLSLPPNTSLQPYSRATAAVTGEEPVRGRMLEAIRWRLETPAPFRVQDGILATEWLRTSRLRVAERALGSLPPSLNGKLDDAKIDDRHAHAHWFWLGDDQGRVAELALLLPAADLDPAAAAAMVADSSFRGYRDWNPTGFRSGQVHVTALGEAKWVLHGLVGSASSWTTRTPYLPVRHRKRKQSVEEWIESDVAHECAYRGLPEPTEVEIMGDGSVKGGRPLAMTFRRYRWSESMRERREGYWLAVRFAGEVCQDGVLSLGALNHFGFGLFEPKR